MSVHNAKANGFHLIPSFPPIPEVPADNRLVEMGNTFDSQSSEVSSQTLFEESLALKRATLQRAKEMITSFNNWSSEQAFQNGVQTTPDEVTDEKVLEAYNEAFETLRAKLEELINAFSLDQLAGVLDYRQGPATLFMQVRFDMRGDMKKVLESFNDPISDAELVVDALKVGIADRAMLAKELPKMKEHVISMIRWHLAHKLWGSIAISEPQMPSRVVIECQYIQQKTDAGTEMKATYGWWGMTQGPSYVNSSENN